ncbi:MAG: helix-turn-helix domain-containing protein [Oscillospiraceae bacterium]|jgi:DNA-binding transcriptional ArsR family regulator|nr:helix-turn-helix domain-containing protein [Oscillospiraceae bacterium]
MKFLPEPGLLYDAISYGLIYFNHNIVKQRKRNAANESPLMFFDKFHIGKRKIEPPQTLYPFFWFNNRRATLMYSYFSQFFNFDCPDVPGFLATLKTREFRSFCVNYYLAPFASKLNLERVAAGDPAECIRAIACLADQVTELTSFVDFFVDFDSLASELEYFLAESYRRLEGFHKGYSELVKDLRRELEVSGDAIKRMQNIDANHSMLHDSYTIHLMEHSVVFALRIGEDRYIFCMGASSRRTITHWGGYYDITMQSFGNSFGNEFMYKIIQELRKGDDTITMLSKKLYISRSTIDRCMSRLYDELIVRIAKKVGTEIYYALDPDYFVVARERILNEIDSILSDLSI